MSNVEVWICHSWILLSRHVVHLEIVVLLFALVILTMQVTISHFLSSVERMSVLKIPDRVGIIRQG